jgi:predicted transcriptional regulator
VILSIKPKYAEAILSGEKKCEFRKPSFPKGVKTAIIYETAPIQKIVGWFKITKQETGKPSEIWKKHSKIGGITRNEFFDYYNGSKQAVCLKIGKVGRLESPMDPFEMFDGFVIPQSFRYVNNNDFSFLISKIPEFQNQRLITEQYNENESFLRF